MDEDGAITRLIHYIDTEMENPENDEDWYPEDVRLAHVYSMWAANEILDALMDSDCLLPEPITHISKSTTKEIVDEFIAMVDDYERYSTTQNGKFVFGIAGDEARRIKAYIC